MINISGCVYKEIWFINNVINNDTEVKLDSWKQFNNCITGQDKNDILPVKKDVVLSGINNSIETGKSTRMYKPDQQKV